jgi:hypothetical protein
MAIDDIKKDISKLDNCNRSSISYVEFSKIINMYFQLGLKEALDGYTFTMYKNFGDIKIVKTLTKLFTPKSKGVTNGGKDVYDKNLKQQIEDNGGYWYFYKWIAPKRWRTHKFNPNSKHKKAMMEKVNTGFDYIDYTYLGINDGYVRKIK